MEANGARDSTRCTPEEAKGTGGKGKKDLFLFQCLYRTSRLLYSGTKLLGTNLVGLGLLDLAQMAAWDLLLQACNWVTGSLEPPRPS